MRIRQRAGRAALAILLTAGAPAVPADFDLGDRVDHCEIIGLSTEDLDASIASSAPLVPGAGLAAGATEWYVSWDYVPWKRRRGACELTHIEVSLQASVTLPRWRDRDRAPSELIAWWETFYEALQEHESGHVRNARAAREAVAEAIAAVGSQGTCGAAMRLAEDAANRVILEHRDRDREFDRETRGGMKKYEAALERHSAPAPPAPR